MLLAGFLLTFPVTVGAQKKEGTNSAAGDEASAAKSSPSVEAALNLAMAQDLIAYGRKHQAPEALITAAGILARNEPTALKDGPKSERNAKAGQEGKKDPRKTDNSPAALLVEARKLAGSKAHIQALADAMAKDIADVPRGAVGGPKRSDTEVLAFSADRYNITFRGGEPAIVEVRGDGDTTLDVIVLDENGNLVRETSGPGDKCTVRWVPRWTGNFVIRVVNRGSVFNRYVLVTN